MTPSDNQRSNDRNSDRGRRPLRWGAVRHNWPEYLIELWALGFFMTLVGFLVTLFESPKSMIYVRIPDPRARLAFLALLVGLALALIIQTPWGKRSGAHMNPAITLAFLRLKKVHPIDALFYVLAQLIGGTLGIALVTLSLRRLFTEPPVQYAVTVPGRTGELAAFATEMATSCLLMLVILIFTASPRLIRFTSAAVGIAVAVFIMIAAPFSGASMNPARTLASAVPAMMWQHLWVYLLGPTMGMLLAAQCHGLISGRNSLGCAKLLHPKNVRCIHCGYLCSQLLYTRGSTGTFDDRHKPRHSDASEITEMRGNQLNSDVSV